MVKKTVKEVCSSLAIPSPLVHMCLFVRSRSMLKMEHLTFLSSHFQHLRWVPNDDGTHVWSCGGGCLASS